MSIKLPFGDKLLTYVRLLILVAVIHYPCGLKAQFLQMDNMGRSSDINHQFNNILPAPVVHRSTIPLFGSDVLSDSRIPSQVGGSRWVTPSLTIKTNITELATTTLNVGIEQWLTDRMTISVPVSYNPWTFADNKKIKHLAVQPELRLWFGETFRGSFINVQSFIGLQAHYLYYNVGGINIPFGMFPDPKETRYEGQGAGGGLTYGNQFGLGGRWRGEIGTTLVFSYLWYDSYECRTCGSFKGSGTNRYIGPGKSSLSIIYLTAIYALY